MAGGKLVLGWGLLVAVSGGCRPSPGPSTKEPARREVKTTVESPGPESSRPTHLVELHRGKFRMGDDGGTARERPAHEVEVKTFYLEEHEVTARQYLACVKAGKCTQPGEKGNYGDLKMDKGTPELLDLGCTGHDPERLDHPITCIDWFQAKAYCEWLGRRLPTEEEWEYAARGPTSRTFVWGEDESLEQGGANTCEQDCLTFAKKNGLYAAAAFDKWDGYPLTAPPKRFRHDVTPEGVYDLAGNVSEWTGSAYCPYSEPECVSEEKVIRGASWEVPWALPLSGRGKLSPKASYGSLGLRCAKP